MRRASPYTGPLAGCLLLALAACSTTPPGDGVVPPPTAPVIQGCVLGPPDYPACEPVPEIVPDPAYNNYVDPYYGYPGYPSSGFIYGPPTVPVPEPVAPPPAHKPPPRPPSNPPPKHRRRAEPPPCKPEPNRPCP